MRRKTPGLTAVFAAADRARGDAADLAAAWCSSAKPTTLNNAQRSYV